VSGLVRAAWSTLPKGHSLSEQAWESRHRGVSILLWLHVVALPVVGVVRGRSLSHSLLESGVVGILALGAGVRRFGRDTRAGLATVGLVMSSAVLVHFFNGLVEMHFHFFVMVVVVSLYQSWMPFLLALAFVLLQHGIVAPVHMDAHNHPGTHAWTWALVHGGFILAQSVACLVCWRVSENALDGEREARGAMETAHQELAVAQSLAEVGSWEWDVPAHVVTWSAQMYLMAGLEPGSMTPTVESFLEVIHEDDHDRVAALLGTAVSEQTRLDYECRLVHPDGTVRVIHALGECVVSETGAVTKLFGTCQDITERKQLQEEIEHMAFHDALTGLANRSLLFNRLEHVLAVQRRSGHGSAVLFMDLDDFKKINDTLGHSAGDQLLVEIGRRLKACVRSNDTVSRLGGDEFAVLLEGAGLAEATETAERIQLALRRPVCMEGGAHTVQTSIGVTVTADRSRADDVLRDADAAMYAAKRRGKNAYSTFPSVSY
jgi:diguanylate cyclase (GGDEF)-like protein/PAS domain S-box-containing protein